MSSAGEKMGFHKQTKLFEHLMIKPGDEGHPHSWKVKPVYFYDLFVLFSLGNYQSWFLKIIFCD